MEKREKIIVIVSIIAAAYGALDFLVLSKSDDSNSTAVQESSSEIIIAAKTKLSSQAVDGQVQSLIHEINTTWPKDVFYQQHQDYVVQDKDLTAEKEAIQEQFDPGLFQYSGFLKMGDEKFAIINGLDYKIGDNIVGYTLSQIFPEKIQVTLDGQQFHVSIKPEREAGNVSRSNEPAEIETLQK